jgi:hypothetical protein
MLMLMLLLFLVSPAQLKFQSPSPVDDNISEADAEIVVDAVALLSPHDSVPRRS